MINEELHNPLSDAMEQLRAQATTPAESPLEWSELTASGSTGNSRVTVVVNAYSVTVETKSAAELDSPQIAAVRGEVGAAGDPSRTKSCGVLDRVW